MTIIAYNKYARPGSTDEFLDSIPGATPFSGYDETPEIEDHLWKCCLNRILENSKSGTVLFVGHLHDKQITDLKNIVTENMVLVVRCSSAGLSGCQDIQGKIVILELIPRYGDVARNNEWSRIIDALQKNFEKIGDGDVSSIPELARFFIIEYNAIRALAILSIGYLIVRAQSADDQESVALCRSTLDSEYPMPVVPDLAKATKCILENEYWEPLKNMKNTIERQMEGFCYRRIEPVLNLLDAIDKETIITPTLVADAYKSLFENGKIQ